MVLALLAAAFVAAHWATGLQDVWGRGMLTFDTLWYHGPFAARIADTGSVWGMHFIDPLYLNWFYPENSELLHAAGSSSSTGTSSVPLVNFGWLGVAAAGRLVHRPPVRRRAPLADGVAIAMDTGPMVPREAGTPATDTVPVALLLAAAAILINAWADARGPRPEERRPPGGGPIGALLVAGLAMGIALGSKLTISGATAAMAVGVIFIVPPGHPPQGLRRLRGRGRRHRRLLVPPEPDPLRATRSPGSATSGRSSCPARTAGSRAATTSPSPTTSSPTRAPASGAPTSSIRSRTCSGRSGS